MNLSNRTQSIIAGALYDFMGYLTTRPKSVEFGATKEAAPIVDLFTEWAAQRGLDTEKAMVEDWSTQPGEVTLASIASSGAVEQRRIAGALLSCIDFVEAAETKDYENAMLRWASKTGLSLANPQPRWSMTEWG